MYTIVAFINHKYTMAWTGITKHEI